MAAVNDATFDVVVYDPPHVPNQGTGPTKDFVSDLDSAGKPQGSRLQLRS